MTQEAAFLQAIVEAPEDDTPRLVFADWLDEQGQSARAEFIRVQVALAKTDEEDPKSDVLARRARDSWVEHSSEWLEELPAWARKKAVYRRGFAEHITARAGSFVKGAKALFAAAPVRHAHLVYAIGSATDVPDEDLAACPYLAGLTGLKVGGFPDSGRIGDGGARTLAGSPHLAGLRSLDLSANNLTAAGAGFLAASPYLPRLHALNVTGNPFNPTDNRAGDAGAAAVASSPHFGGLRELRLAGNALGPPAIRALAESFYLKNLRILDLGANPLGPEGGRALAQARSLLARLTELGLCDTNVGAAAVAALFAPGGARLKVVDLTATGAGHGTLAQVFAGPAGEHLRGLTLDRVGLGDYSGALGILAPLRLQSLTICGNGIGDDVAAILAGMPLLEDLRRLDLGMNEIGPAGARALAESPRLAKLRALNLFANNLGSAGAEALARSPHLARLRELGLGRNKIGDTGARALAASPHLAGLSLLTLGGNPVRKNAKEELKKRFGPFVDWTS
jgi:uncharacterized protein (TIGR02996 family)